MLVQRLGSEYLFLLYADDYYYTLVQLTNVGWFYIEIMLYFVEGKCLFGNTQ